ncbi:hypothetical protein BJ742DRAFT_332985 [Cladochytrium replicatum]|nr:hypothetical protein BJ742DRAFT_332985 [Cladochytrium replicatum]
MILELYPKVPPEIQRLVFVKVLKLILLIWKPGRNSYTIQNVKVGKSGDVPAAASKLTSSQLINPSTKTTLTTPSKITSNFKIKYLFSVYNQQYQWVPSREVPTIGGFYKQTAPAVGGGGVFCGLPGHKVVASYMKGTGMLDMLEDLYDQEDVRDIDCEPGSCLEGWGCCGFGRSPQLMRNGRSNFRLMDKRPLNP